MKNILNLNTLAVVSILVLIFNIYILGLSAIMLFGQSCGYSSLINTIIAFIYGFIFGWNLIKIYKYLERSIKQFLMIEG